MPRYSDAVDAIKGIGATIGEVSAVATSTAAAVEEHPNAQEAVRVVSESISGVSEGADATGAAARGVKTAADALGVQAERLHDQVGDFLAKIRAA